MQEHPTYGFATEAEFNQLQQERNPLASKYLLQKIEQRKRDSKKAVSKRSFRTSM